MLININLNINMWSERSEVFNRWVMSDRIFLLYFRLELFIQFQIINIEQQTSRSITPTTEGKSLISNGSYEYNLYQAVPVDSGIEQPQLMVRIDRFELNVFNS